MTTKRVLSYGGGLDSFTMLVKAIQLGIHLDYVTFINVGDPQGQDPGEWPSTYRHIIEVAIPLCNAHGIPFVIIDADQYPVRGHRSLFAFMQAMRRFPTTGKGHRLCTSAAKIERFEKWLKDTFGDELVEVWIGFDAAEAKRAARDPNLGTKKVRRVNRYPLIEWNLCRCRCEELVRAAGYPVPRKSACVFCPYGSKGDFQTLQRELPETFAKIVQLEADRPLTADGNRLSLVGYDSKKFKRLKAKGERYVPRPLPVWTAMPYEPEVEPCSICGAAQRATKATACSFLDEEATAEAA